MQLMQVVVKANDYAMSAYPNARPRRCGVDNPGDISVAGLAVALQGVQDASGLSVIEGA